MPVTLRNTRPLCLTTDANGTLLDTGAAYAECLRGIEGAQSRRLSELLTHVSETVNPQSQKHQATMFEYIDLAEVEETLGAIMTNRQLLGGDIASSKVRFRQGDILLAKLRPSIDNKKLHMCFRNIQTRSPRPNSLCLGRSGRKTCSLSSPRFGRTNSRTRSSPAAVAIQAAKGFCQAVY